MIGEPRSIGASRTCPLCGRSFDPLISPAMPFCSERCRSIDLGRWLGEDYKLPDRETPNDESSAEDE